jgi:myo-inositol 2-dehydrogenase/D-chiro-inositol 1-dehydrogenase
MAPLRLAIIGCGSWSSRMHLPALTNVCRTRHVLCAGVCDLDGHQAEEYARRLAAGVSPAAAAPAIFTDIDRMLSDLRPEGVLVLVPPPVTAGVIEQMARHRIPFLAEKPPAPDTATHRRLIEQVGDLAHVVAYNRRHAPYIRQAKDWMQDGQVQSVTVLFSRHRRREQDFTSTAVHAIDTAWYLAGGQFAAMRAEAAPAGQAISYFISGWTAGGTRIDILCTPDTASAVEHYIVRSDERTVFVSYPQTSMIDVPGFVELQEDNKVVSRKSAGDFGIDPADAATLGGILGEQMLFCDVLRGAAEPICTLSNTLQTQQVREALSTLLARGGRGVMELDLAGGSECRH